MEGVVTIVWDGQDAFDRLNDAEAEVVRLTEGLRWIAAGLTGSYGTPQAFAAAILEDEEDTRG